VKVSAVKFLTNMLLLGLVSSSLLAAPSDVLPAKSTSMTIGQFAVAVAKSMDDAPETKATLSSEAALATLKESGLSFSAGSEAVLTQAELAAFLRQAGIKVSVTSPEQPVSAEQAKTAISGFGSLFASKAGVPGKPPVVTNTGHALPESFADCASLPKVPECRSCCINMGMSLQACGKACGRAHAALQVSASEPTP
jgi:hypothetical protein